MAKKCSTCVKPARKWYKERLYITLLIFIGVTGASYFFLRSYFNAVFDFLSLIWWAIILGFFIGGLIDHYVPRSYISKYLSQHRKRTILYSVVFGFLASACSHGILAIAIELYRKGASTPSVIAFLLASPWANLPITIILFGFFGINALLFVMSAIIIAVITGLIYQFLDRRCYIECVNKDIDVGEGFSIREDVKRRLRGYTFSSENLKKDVKGILRGSWSLSRMVLWWILVGIMLAGVFRIFAENFHALFNFYLGPSLIGLGVTLVLATVIEVCSEGSAPIAFEIFNQTRAFGNAFVFLMAGVATDYTEIGIIASNIGKRTALFLPLITVPQILLLGYIFNAFL